MEVDSSVAWKKFENGASVYKIAQGQNLGYHVLRDRLLYSNPRKYRKIMDKRKRRGKPIPTKLLKKIVKKTENGQNLKDLAKKNNVGFTTLRRRLPQIMGIKNYKKIMDEHQRRRISSKLLRKIGKRLEDGEPVRQLALKYGLGETTLNRRLPQTIGYKKYDEIVGKRRTTRKDPEVLREAAIEMENGISLNEIART